MSQDPQGRTESQMGNSLHHLDGFALGTSMGLAGFLATAGPEAVSEPGPEAEPCVRTVVRWESCPSDLEAVPPELQTSDWTSLDAYEACQEQQGSAVVIDCGEWPCIVAVAYTSKSTYDQTPCRDVLSDAKLPMRTSTLLDDDGDLYVRRYWLADTSLIERWDDQAWRERQAAREMLLARRIRDELTR